MSMNCRGLGETKKRRDVMHYIRSKRFSIVFLQDTHLTLKTIPYFNTLWHGKAYHSCFSSRSRGTSILFNSNLQYSHIEDRTSDCGNYLMVACKIFSESYLLVNVYGPNEDNPIFYKNLNEMIDKFDVQYTIVAGDLNFVINPEKDSLNYVGENNVRAKEKFIALTYKHNLVDAWRHTFPNQRKYTWLRKNPLKAGRLDMFFVSDNMLNAITDVGIEPGYRTDHNVITLAIQGKQQRGNGIWKCNMSHLTDENYINTVKACITNTLKQYAVPVYNEEVFSNYEHYESMQLTISDALFYETLIMMIRGETVRFSKQKARRKRTVEETLLKDIVKAEENFLGSGQQSEASELEVLKNKLEDLRRPMIDGMIVRSRVSWHEQGERNTKYFLSLEKRNSCKKSIQYIQEEDKMVTDIAEIIDKFSDIFQNKYRLNAEIKPDKAFIANHVSSRLNTHEKVELDAEISMQELTSALSSMKKEKPLAQMGSLLSFSVHFGMK